MLLRGFIYVIFVIIIVVASLLFPWKFFYTKIAHTEEIRSIPTVVVGEVKIIDKKIYKICLDGFYYYIFTSSWNHHKFSVLPMLNKDQKLVECKGK